MGRTGRTRGAVTAAVLLRGLASDDPEEAKARQSRLRANPATIPALREPPRDRRMQGALGCRPKHGGRLEEDRGREPREDSMSSVREGRRRHPRGVVAGAIPAAKRPPDTTGVDARRCRRAIAERIVDRIDRTVRNRAPEGLLLAAASAIAAAGRPRAPCRRTNPVPAGHLYLAGKRALLLGVDVLFRRLYVLPAAAPAEGEGAPREAPLPRVAEVMSKQRLKPSYPQEIGAKEALSGDDLHTTNASQHRRGASGTHGCGWAPGMTRRQRVVLSAVGRPDISRTG
jgi:hypothetical protein